MPEFWGKSEPICFNSGPNPLLYLMIIIMYINIKSSIQIKSSCQICFRVNRVHTYSTLLEFWLHFEYLQSLHLVSLSMPIGNVVFLCIETLFFINKKTSATHFRHVDEITHHGYALCNFRWFKRKLDFVRFPNLNTKHVSGFKESLHVTSQCSLHLIERSSQECIHWFLSF